MTVSLVPERSGFFLSIFCHAVDGTDFGLI